MCRFQRFAATRIGAWRAPESIFTIICRWMNRSAKRLSSNSGGFVPKPFDGLLDAIEIVVGTYEKRSVDGSRGREGVGAIKCHPVSLLQNGAPLPALLRIVGRNAHLLETLETRPNVARRRPDDAYLAMESRRPDTVHYRMPSFRTRSDGRKQVVYPVTSRTSGT